MNSSIRKKFLYGIAILAVILCHGFALPVSASFESAGEDQTLNVDPTGKEEGYSAVLYNSSNGLPTSEANAIEETSEGFIWIGSYSGLIRYDGNTFERTDSTTGIASVVSLFVDRDDRLWVGTNDSGAAMLSHGDKVMYTKSDGLQSSSVRCINQDAQGNIFLGTARGLAMVISLDRIAFVEDERLSDQYIRRMECGSDGRICGITQDGAVFVLDGTNVALFLDTDALGIPEVRTIVPDPKKDGYVYLGTETSEVYYGKLTENGLSDKKVIDVSPLVYINEVEVFDDQIWFCADNGIGILKDNNFHILDNMPMTSSIEHIKTDYSGNVWCTSSRQGVMKIVPNQFSDVFERFELPDMVVNTTCLYNDKTLLIGADSGLTVLNQDTVADSFPVEKCVTASGKDLECQDLMELIGNFRIRSILKDSKNRLWFATYSKYGLLCYDNGVVTCYTPDDGMPSDRIRTTYELRNGSILAPCSGGGVVVIRDGKIADVYNADNGISFADILTVSEADNGDVIFGSDGDGLYVFRGDEQIKHAGTDDGLLSDVVMRVKKDDNHHVFWIVTSNSLAYMDEDYNITSIKKFPYSNNFDLYENSRGDMWILSSNGIYVISAEELLANGEQLVPVYYGRANGLPCIATANSYSELTNGGDLYISGTNGVAKVNIEKQFQDVTDLKMAVPYVEADGKYIYAQKDGNIIIPAETKKLTIHSFVYNYSLLNPQVTYYLDGFEQLETTVTRDELAPVSYTNLKGGDYQFVMKLKDAMGRGGKELIVHIIKEKAIYEQMWFIVMMVIAVIFAVALVIYLINRVQTRRYEKKMAENKILIHEMTEAFAKVIDMKDKYTNGHSTRVAEYTAKLARELGYDEETVENYYNIALLHDIGKVGIPPEVLNKPGKLTDEEFKIIKSHSSLGYRALKDISIMPDLATGAGAHHERPDGKGYPRGLKGDEIPRVAQIIAVADTFDAMYSNRPYRKRMNFDKVVSIIREVSGTQLTSDVVDAFLRLVEKGEFRDPDDHGGGSTEDIDNIHKRLDRESAEQKAAMEMEHEIKKKVMKEKKKEEEESASHSDNS
ncbi:MAG: HD domain-containing protein [Solobacterium sp.]|nr:HD domain-containing protein [Solobacterium sp.]